MIMLGSERDDDYGQVLAVPGPQGVNTQTVYVVVDDPQPLYDHAVEAGADIVMDLQHPEYGGTLFACRDPEGHLEHRLVRSLGDPAVGGFSTTNQQVQIFCGILPLFACAARFLLQKRPKATVDLEPSGWRRTQIALEPWVKSLYVVSLEGGSISVGSGSCTITADQRLNS